MNWESVIGLEVHLQLATRSKIFSGSATTFGAEPNTQASAVDLAMPGMLPVLNAEAVHYAVKFGLGIGAKIGKRSIFDRKNYFYPDSPKGYQISQFEAPIVGEGNFEISLPDGSTRSIGITRAHLEEDAGKSLHEDYHGQSGIDLNRAGTPLLEIVSEPDIRNATEAVAYLKALHSLVTYLEISDGNMAEGSMRCDINISLRPQGSSTLGTRAEIKNVNSFRFVEKAIQHEIERQSDILEDGGTIVQETRLYDAQRDETRPMRSKEVANDYRYFPEPDLLPVVIDDPYILAIQHTLPELPTTKRHRFAEAYGLSNYDASVLTDTRPLADYFEVVVAACNDAKIAANWVQVELLGQLNRDQTSLAQCPVPAADLGGLIARILDGSISGKIAKQVFEAMWQGEGSADSVIEARGLKQVSDSGALEGIIAEVIASHPEQVQQFLEADEDRRKKLTGFFVGQVMKVSKGQANPQMVNELLAKKLV
ncbi:Asp-tRNA(Asn)/Glu-tRNA(Gln) amidotransferase subunit GatB [Candidatus Marimicrobium litorale]|uniref:Aspartyl/glutamyl-tRNA(Asn/Gln) amidotransferase subunit B n=1 Tax=Candidatus Marimicrobium litorale TaxID=2518991 RepID=A0ABT3T589_9GAMM|nr:Asp-tRNA(Asn)/Glu-tRNA(Gln) amidotransferase subunit GatB [Candidatus Marimicrobium litorale]MCX2977340.1 Asp-tRNA(Asn)/Glu-tRNA(Gln) amidotransferase subunit GatB [Candidatus Marimicrobium litorale]